MKRIELTEQDRDFLAEAFNTVASKHNLPWSNSDRRLYERAMRVLKSAHYTSDVGRIDSEPMCHAKFLCTKDSMVNLNHLLAVKPCPESKDKTHYLLVFDTGQEITFPEEAGNVLASHWLRDVNPT